MKYFKNKIKKVNSRKNRVRAQIKSSLERPRLSLFVSNQNIYLQVIDDTNGKTLVSSSTTAKTAEKKDKKISLMVEELIKKMKEAGIKKVVVDRGPKKYHGNVKLISDTLRKGGIQI